MLAKTGMGCDEGCRIRHLSLFMGARLPGSFAGPGRRRGQPDPQSLLRPAIFLVACFLRILFRFNPAFFTVGH